MATTEVKFFKHRRKMEVRDFTSLMSAGNERRIKAGLRIPMSNLPTKGVPDWVLDGYQFVVKDDSPYNKTSCKKIEMDGMSVSFFTSDETQRKMTGVGGLNGCKMDRFVVERIGDDEKAIVYLSFILYVACTEDILLWFFKHQHGEVFAEFDTTQATLVYTGEDEDEDDGQETLALADPNDNPDQPIPGDTREVTPGNSKPAKKASKKPVVH